MLQAPPAPSGCHEVPSPPSLPQAAVRDPATAAGMMSEERILIRSRIAMEHDRGLWRGCAVEGEGPPLLITLPEMDVKSAGKRRMGSEKR